MNRTTRKPITILAIGSAIGAGTVILVGFAVTQLTFPQFQAVGHSLAFLLNLAFVLWAVLYAPLKTRALNGRIKSLEAIIHSPNADRSAIVPTARR